jgi:XTP/dITP diphosphohydrolase
MTIYIATTNPGKLRDFTAAAAQRILMTPLPGLKEIAPPIEDQPTFEGNARLKALYYSHHAPGQIVVADDSGLEVDALDGAPGVRSARYADDAGYPGPPDTTLDDRNNLCLLEALRNTPEAHRQARYHCVLAAACNGEILALGDAAVEGQILTAPRGAQGFGYDPLFYLPQYHRTMAELDATAKLAFSHRGRALDSLLIALLPLLPSDHERSHAT